MDLSKLPERTAYQPTTNDTNRALALWLVLARAYERDLVTYDAFIKLREAYLLARRSMNIYTNHRRYDLYGGIPSYKVC